MVKNPVYKGEFVAQPWYYKKVKSKRSGRMVTRKLQRPREEWIIVPVPAIVSAKVWDLAQETTKKNRTLSTKKAKYPFLLQGLLVCAGCGHANGASARLRRKNGKGYRIACYRCGGRNYRVKVVRERIGCTQSQISAQKLDPVVWTVIMELLTDPSNLTSALDEYYADTRSEEIQQEISFIDERIAERQAEDEKLYRAYLKNVFDEQEYAIRRREVKDALQKLQQERDRLAARLMTEEDLARHKAAITEMAQKVERKLLTMEVPFELKRRLVRMLVDHIELNVNEGRFTV
jgi:site-specific DNA recombinase